MTPVIVNLSIISHFSSVIEAKVLYVFNFSLHLNWILLCFILVYMFINLKEKEPSKEIGYLSPTSLIRKEREHQTIDFLQKKTTLSLTTSIVVHYVTRYGHTHTHDHVYTYISIYNMKKYHTWSGMIMYHSGTLRTPGYSGWTSFKCKSFY